MTIPLPDALVTPAALGRAQRDLESQTSPAAATDFTLTLDSRYVWRFLTVRCTLTTDANVANREVTFQYLNANGNVFDEMGAATVVTANNTAFYTFSAFQTTAEFTVNSGALIPLHPTFLEGGLAVRLHIVNVQAADALSAIRTYVERFYSDDAR